MFALKHRPALRDLCSISLAGQSGPLSDKPGFDYMGAAYAGITAAVGELDRGPAQLPIAIGDSATGVTEAMAVGFALLHRERQYIDCSLLDTYFNMHASSCRSQLGRTCGGLTHTRLDWWLRRRRHRPTHPA